MINKVTFENFCQTVSTKNSYNRQEEYRKTQLGIRFTTCHMLHPTAHTHTNTDMLSLTHCLLLNALLKGTTPCAAVCCNMSQCVASKYMKSYPCCNMLQCVANVAVCCIKVHQVTPCIPQSARNWMRCRKCIHHVLQCVAVCRSVLHQSTSSHILVAICCSEL